MRSDYKIAFVGLKLGKHEFKYTINNSFFGTLGIEPEHLLVQNGHFNILLVFDKQQENLFHLDFKMEGVLILKCERCLDDFEYPLAVEEKQWVKVGEVDFDDPDIYVLPKNEFQLDISPMIYEFISLATPMIRIHFEDEFRNPSCSNETSAVLKKFQIPDSESNLDPRWEALKGLQKKS